MMILGVFAFTLTLVCLERISANFNEIRPPWIFPDDYDKYEPPWEEGKPAKVYIQLFVMDVDSIDEENMQFSIQSYLDEYWKDTRLNLSSFVGKDDPQFPTYLTPYIWVPDLVFDNTKSGTLFSLSIPNQSMVIMEDGTFHRTTRYNMVIGCHMKFQFYPMDTQKCFMKIASMVNSEKKVQLYWAEEFETEEYESISYVNNIEPLKYDLLKPEPYKTFEIWPSGICTVLYANFTFVRRVSGSLFNVYVPSTLVVFLSWISFWLDAEAVPARVTLGVTSLLTLATQIVQAHAGLPTISYMTAMDVWLFACLISVFCSLLEFAFSYQLFAISKQSTVQNESKCLKCMKPKVVDVRIIRSRMMPDSRLYRSNVGVSENSNKPRRNPRSLDLLCRKLFPFLFFVFSFAYWLSYSLKK